MKRIVILALFLAGCTAPAPVTTKVKMPPSPSGLVVRQAPKAAVARTVTAALVVRTNNLPGLGYHIVPRPSVPVTRKTKVGMLLMGMTPMAAPGNVLIQPVMIVPPVWVPDPIYGGILYTWSDFLTTGAYYVAQTNSTLKAVDWGNVGVAMKWTGTTNDVLGVGCAAPNPHLFERIKVSVTP